MSYAKVHVWMPRGGPINWIGYGHGSLELLNMNKYYYITWLSTGPGVVLAQNIAAHPALGFTRVKNQQGNVVTNPWHYNSYPSTSYSFDDDVDTYKRQPEYNFDVPISVIDPGKQGHQLFGVNVHRMEQFWLTLLKLEPGHPNRRYAFRSSRISCDAVVVDALLEGGLDFYAPPPGNLVVQDAGTLADWVKTDVARITEMNKQYREILMELQGDKLERELLPEERTVPK